MNKQKNIITMPTIELSQLIPLCETSTLQKGIKLMQSGAVRQLKVDGDKVTAQVKGSYLYQVSLDLRGELSADCDCPAAQYQMCCKHAVAVYMSLQDSSVLSEQESERELIKKHLKSLGEEVVIEKLLDCLENDEQQWSLLLTQINLRQKTSASYGELKKLITKALPREQIWDWRESSGYFYSAENQLTEIVEVMLGLNIDKQWKLINYLAERLNAVLEHIDDSSGDRFGIEDLINTHMPKIFTQLNWSEEKKAQWMFERLTNYEFDVFPSINEDFEVAWKKNPTFLTLCRDAIAQTEKNGDHSWDLIRWAKPLIDTASDWREVVSIKQNIANRCQDYLEIVQTYIANGEPLEGEFWLAKARKIATDYELKSCDKAQFTLYVALGEIGSAWALGTRMFEQWPSFSRYQQLAKFKHRHAISDEQFLARTESIFKSSYQPPNQFGSTFDRTDALLAFYIDQKVWDKACDWVATRKVSSDILLKLADCVVAAMPDNTLNYYLRVINVTIEQTNNDAYARALDLLVRLEALLKPHSRQLKQFYIEVASLAQTYKRKRNMLKLIKQQYAEYL